MREGQVQDTNAATTVSCVSRFDNMRLTQILLLMQVLLESSIELRLPGYLVRLHQDFPHRSAQKMALALSVLLRGH